jgi:hypothetical protein
MEKEFAPYEMALRLKALGFDEPCFAKYQKLSESANYQLQLLQKERNCNRLDTAISAPTFSQAFRWFRKNYGLWFRPDYYDELKEYNFQGNIHKLGNFSSLADIGNYNTCEEAELACLEKIIEIVESENK